MLTDWSLIRRLGYELDRRLRGGRLVGAGVLADRQVGLLLRKRSDSWILAVDAFASPPLVSLEPGERDVVAEPGFARALAASLRGMTLAAVRARRGDRLLRLEFCARSRFGIETRLDLFLELVPRFGNLVLVKDGRIVAALKEFAPGEHPRRPVAPGFEYVLPPLPSNALLPKLAAISGYDEEAFVRRAESEEAMTEPLYVYRRGEELQASLVPLSLPGMAQTREPSVLDVFSEALAAQRGHRQGSRLTQRRSRALRLLREHHARLRGELAALAGKRRQIDARDALRVEGEKIVATLHLLDPALRKDAAQRAAELFAQYKRLGKALAHVEERERAIASAIETNEALLWELERAADEDFADVEAAIEQVSARRARRSPPPARRRKRPPLEFRTAAGSRILVGRSPSENAELTFQVARPGDLWFHAQKVPGAHVILTRDGRDATPPEDVETAAAVAAYHSKARFSGTVAVDYTQRKNVRKQRGAPAGLVWYTHQKTIVVTPRAAGAMNES